MSGSQSAPEPATEAAAPLLKVMTGTRRPSASRTSPDTTRAM